MPDKLWMLFSALIMIIWGYMILNPHNTESLDKAQNNFELGCLVSAQSLCSMVENEDQRNVCYDVSATGCPESALKFRRYLEGK